MRQTGPCCDADIRQQGNVSCISAGASNVFVGTPEGILKFLDRSFRSVLSFKAHETGSITHIEQIPDTALLVTLAEDLSNEPTLKVWALDRLDKKTGIPRCLCTVAIQNGRKQFPVRRSSGGRNTRLLLIAPGFCICCPPRLDSGSRGLCEWRRHHCTRRLYP